MGDVLSCSAKGALSYRWTNLHNDSDADHYGKSLIISQAGRFSYECSVFVDGGTDLACTITRNISGFATGITLNVIGYIRQSTSNGKQYQENHQEMRYLSTTPL